MGGQNRFPPPKTRLARVKKFLVLAMEKQHLSRETFFKKRFWGELENRSKNFDMIQGFLEIEKYKRCVSIENPTQMIFSLTVGKY